jgi:hypothetical protein
MAVFEHNQTRLSEIVARDGHKYIMLGEAMVHHTDLTDTHKQALNNPRQPDGVGK